MRQLLDLDRFALDRPDSEGGKALIARCRRELREFGMFSFGDRARIIAVFSCYETPDVTFSETERLGFYGRRGEIE